MIRVALLVCLFFLPLLTFAQSEDFTITVFGSADIIPPTTPVISSVIPVTYSQVDIAWSTSTDNFTVFGYVVLRDGVAIATTTVTNYSDAGLTASTTYSYEVVAFDTVPNYSTSSVAVATTTLAAPLVITATSTSQGGTVARTVLDNLKVVPDVTSAKIDLSVRQPARIEVRLGETTGYETGYFVGNIYRRDHAIPLGGLRPNTNYYYEIVGYTQLGVQTILKQGSFTTLSDTLPPSPINVTGFTAEVQVDDVILSWDLSPDFSINARVRVVKSHLGFPTTINDGVVIYEGVGHTVRDQAAFTNHDLVYYTAFVIDATGSVSSGAVALARVNNAATLPGDFSKSPIGGEVGIVPQPATSTEFVQVPQDPNMPQPSDIYVTQADKIFSFSSTTITLSSDDLFVVSVPANKIIGAFKTLVATLGDPRGSGKQFSFLLRLNSERTEFLATIAPVHFADVSDLVVEVFDYEAKVVGNYKTQITFEADRSTSSTTLETLFWHLKTLLWGSLLLVPLITLGFLWFVFRRRSDEDEDNETSV